MTTSLIILASAFLFISGATTNRVSNLPRNLVTPSGTICNFPAASAATKAAYGYFSLDETQPSATATNYYTRAGYERVDGNPPTYRVKWESHEIPAPVTVHRYSKLKIITAAKSRGKWASLKAWIEAEGYYDEWLVCQYLASDYSGFDTIIAAIVTAGVATREEIDAILAESIDETL